MGEYLIYSKSDWEKGDIFGAYIDDSDNIVNRFQELNNDDFINPIISDWKTDSILEDFTDTWTTKESSKCRIAVTKDSDKDLIEEDKFGKISTKFYQNDIPAALDIITINFDWNAYETSQKEEAVISLNDGEDAYVEVVLSNKADVNIHTFDGTNHFYDEVIETASDSVGDISNFINNNIKDGYIDFRLAKDTNGNNKVEVRFRGSGYKSKWYIHDFSANKFRELNLIQKANIDTKSIVKKELVVDNILVDGYEDNIVYKNDIYDSKEDGTVWDKLTVDGTFPVDQLNNNDSELNFFRIDIYAADNVEDFDKDENIREVVTRPTSNNFTYEDDLILSELNLKGRYLKFELINSVSEKYQNKINYVKFDYTVNSQLETVDKKVVDGEVTEYIDAAGGILELKDNNFDCKFYIPENAVTVGKNITLKRLGSDKNLFAEGMIGFKFEPHMELEKPGLLEVDYNGYQFDTYMSEKGLLLGYLDHNNMPEQLDTFKSYKNKKALAYMFKI